MNGRRVLLGCGGGIAAFKVAALASQLVQRGAEVRVAMTSNAERFIGALTFEGITGRQVIRTSTQVDADGSVPHIEAARWADSYVIAPGTADLLARLAAGCCDDPVSLLAVTCRGRRALCPAMNDTMWQNEVVQRNAAAVEALGFTLLGPEVGHLAEGYHAIGRMVEPDVVLAWLEQDQAGGAGTSVR